MLARFKKAPPIAREELIRKLVELANGDVELVNRAIRSAAGSSTDADLGKIIEYITAHRREVAVHRAEAVN